MSAGEAPVDGIGRRVGGADLPVVARRYPWRWVSAGAVVLLLVWLGSVLATTPTMQWQVVGQYLFSSEVLSGVQGTVVMTVLSMAVGMVLGTVVAVMRLSPNPVLTGVASLYQWFFRGTPTLVQLIFWFNLSSIFPYFQVVGLGVVNTNTVMTPFLASVLGLGLNFAAYYSEIVRAGILSVDEGQSDAATAYGLSRFGTLRHIVLPQAMRVIIPPTGNELIGMLKFTSLASVVSYAELLRRVSDVYNRTYQVIPLLIVAAIWYLFMTTLLSTGQHFLEKHFARGAQRATQVSLAERIVANLRGRGARRP